MTQAATLGRDSAAPARSSRLSIPSFSTLSRYTDPNASQSSASRPKSASTYASDGANNANGVHSYDDILDDRPPNDDDLTDLVDFFKNHAPPSDNFMSIPFGADDKTGRGRWSRLRVIGKRSKSVPRPEPQMRLPDTAVSGKTTSGHRHIAISIPLEASPFGHLPRSQYPVYPPQSAKPSAPSYNGPIRTFVNDKGVVTVLRTVTEDEETLPSLTPAGSRATSEYATARQSPELPAKSPRRQSLSKDPIQDKDEFSPGAVTGAPESHILKEDKNAPAMVEEQSDQPAAFPARKSSAMVSRNLQGTSSIDGILSQSGDLQRSPSAQSEKAIGSGNPSKAPVDEKMSESARSSDVPLLLRDDEPAPPGPAKNRNRRDLVKDRKRRDMEAARNARQKQQQKASEVEQETPANSFDEARTEDGQAAQKRRAEPESQTNARPQARDSAVHIANDKAVKAERAVPAETRSNLTICPIMVVIDEEPSSPTLPTSTSHAGEASGAQSNRPAALDGSTNPTPPQSVHGSPSRKQNSGDRTSLSRRREWNAQRERDRKVQEAKATAHAKAVQLASNSMAYEAAEPARTDKEMLRLYEAYRDHRLREMERRLRRLERNGDVWLQALIPMLDSVNRNMAATARDREEALDEESPVSARPRSKSVEWTKPERLGKKGHARHASANNPGVLDRVARKRGDSEAVGDGEDEAEAEGRDHNGLATLEPLMRELAGEKSRRPKTANMP